MFKMKQCIHILIQNIQLADLIKSRNIINEIQLNINKSLCYNMLRNLIHQRSFKLIKPFASQIKHN